MNETTGSPDRPERKTSVYDDLGGGRNTYYATGNLPTRAAKKPLTGRATMPGTLRRELEERFESHLGTGKDVSASPEQLAKNTDHLRRIQAALSDTILPPETTVVEPVPDVQPTQEQLILPLDRES